MVKIPEKCPSCEGELIITQLECSVCGTQVQGTYKPDLFAKLSSTDFDFVVMFLKTKGNVKEMERELGISYWTIRSKLSDIVENLGLTEDAQGQQETLSERRQAILRRLNEGELSVAEAEELLKSLK